MRYAFLLFLCACGRDLTAPAASVPSNAVRFTPASFEREALDSVRACIQRNGRTPDARLSTDDLAWYTVPGTSFTESGAIYQGYAGPGWIVLAADAPNRQQLTQHELAHQVVHEFVAHSSPFWNACHLMTGYGTVFVIP